MTPTIEVRGVSRWFGPLVALNDVSFTVGPGVTALLGPNGAGKSTLLRVLCGLTAPSRGTVSVLGADPRRDRSVLGQIGLVPQQEALFEDLTAAQFVAAAAALTGHRADAAARAAAALDRVELDPGDTRPVRTYSKGMRQRVKVAQALVHDPEVIVLDEPLEGLDPRQRLAMIALFTDLGRAGATVVVSSHVLEEVQRFGSQILVLAEGRLAAQGDFHGIRNLMDDRPHRIRIGTDDPRRLVAALLTAEAVTGGWVETGHDSAVVDTLDVTAFRHRVASVARQSGVRLRSVVPLDDDLESVFRYLVGRR